MANDKIRIGFIGGGMVMQVAHLPFYRKDPRVEIAGVAESRPSLIEHFQSLGLRLFLDHRQLLLEPGIDAIVVIAPRPAVGPLIEDAVRAGKHVLTEKPFAHTFDQARRIAELAAATKSKCYAVGYMKRHDAGVLHLAELIRNEKFGALVSAHFHHCCFGNVVALPPHRRAAESRANRFATWPLCPEWLPRRFRSSYEWFMNAVSHDVNLMRFLVRDLAVHSARWDGAGLAANLRTPKGAEIVISASQPETQMWDEGASFEFEHGRIALTIPPSMALNRLSTLTVESNGHKYLVQKEGKPAFEMQARNFVDCIRSADCEPATSFEEACHDLAMIEEIWSELTDSQVCLDRRKG